LINQALAILEQDSVTSIPALIDRGFDVGASLFNTKGQSDPGGKKFQDLSQRTQVLVLLNQIAQRNIRDILGESGKTISNVDRDLVNRLVGKITVLTTNAETIKQLNITKDQLLRGVSQRANKIRTQSSFLQDEGGIGYLRSNPALLEFLTSGNIDMGQFNRSITPRDQGSVFNLAGKKV
jgi:chaperonin cofactor prefoldin